MVTTPPSSFTVETKRLWRTMAWLGSNGVIGVAAPAGVAAELDDQTRAIVVTTTRTAINRSTVRITTVAAVWRCGDRVHRSFHPYPSGSRC
jgi:hypothetical protein